MNRLQFATVKSIEQGLIKAAGALSKDLGEIAAPVRRSIDDAVVHAVNDLAALVHHATPGRGIPIHALIGGTGTGKSTLVNRLFGATVSATSYRRTFTTGPVAIVRGSADLPRDWLGLPAVVADEVPSRGVPGALAVVKQPDGNDLIVIDTPDIDGDHPAHIAVADRVFRWADRLVFVVTPEKYQMTELLPYYRLARRYRVPTLFVMNKTEQSVVVDDFRQQLAGREWGDASIYVIERDDSMFVPPEEHSLDRLRNFLAQPAGDDPAVRRAGLRERGRDIVNRVSDQVLTPLRDQQRYCLNILNALNAIETPPPRVDVNPITEQLQRRLQQRSILYLIGPARVLDRVRQVPQLLMRLPRSLVDIARGQKVAIPDPTESQASMAEPPDFSALLLDQMRIVQSRIDDIIRTTPLAAWLDDPQRGYAQAHIDPADAGKIAAEELADLQNWLQQRWESNPRDTRLIMNIMKRLPGGQKLTKWTETAPYLLAVIVATHHAFFGHIDLIVLGGYGLATWITERLSNEVSARARLTNKRIADRFTDLGRRQIEQVRRWLKSQVADDATTARLERDLDELAQQCDAGQER